MMEKMNLFGLLAVIANLLTHAEGSNPWFLLANTSLTLGFLAWHSLVSSPRAPEAIRELKK